jgi:hypothetical protein
MEHVVQGVIGAMAMTGLRRITTGLGLVRKPPPEEVLEDGVPELLAHIPAEHRDEAIELAHWAFGGAAGLAFAGLPRELRESAWTGAAYGLTIWALFETVAAPVLGIRDLGERPARERAALAADHVLYGLVLAGRPRERGA